VLSFDPFGWTGDYPQYVFRVCSDVLLASVISLGILVIDSWLEVAKVVAALKDGRTFTGKDAAPVDYHVLPGEEHIDDEEDVDDPTKSNPLPDAQVAKNPFMDFFGLNPPQDVIRDSPQSAMDKISLYFVRGCLIGVWTWTLAVAAYEVVYIRQIEWVPVVIKGVVYQLFISIVLCFGWYHALRIYRFVEEVHRFQFDTMLRREARSRSITVSPKINNVGFDHSSSTASFDLSPRLREAESRSKERACKVGKLLRFMTFASVASLVLLLVFIFQAYLAWEIWNTDDANYFFDIPQFDNIYTPLVEPVTIYICFCTLLWAFRKPAAGRKREPGQ
jgi:hypothetical protein